MRVAAGAGGGRHYLAEAGGWRHEGNKSKRLSGGAHHHGKSTEYESDFEEEDRTSKKTNKDSASNREHERPRQSIEFREQVEIVGSSSDSSSQSSAYSSEESEMEGDEAGSG